MVSKNVEHISIMVSRFGVHKQEAIPCIDYRRVEWECASGGVHAKESCFFFVWF